MNPYVQWWCVQCIAWNIFFIDIKITVITSYGSSWLWQYEDSMRINLWMWISDDKHLYLWLKAAVWSELHIYTVKRSLLFFNGMMSQYVSSYFPISAGLEKSQRSLYKQNFLMDSIVANTQKQKFCYSGIIPDIWQQTSLLNSTLAFRCLHSCLCMLRFGPPVRRRHFCLSSCDNFVLSLSVISLKVPWSC